MCSALAIQTEAPHPHPGLEEPGTIKLYKPGDSGRDRVESFIREVYQRKFNARVGEFAPMLIALEQQHTIVAAMGLRSGKESPLFLEQYLDTSIEEAIRTLGFHQVSRHHIVEVGQLAAMQAGQGRQLMRAVVPLLADLGFQWVASTVTHELRHLLIRLGIVPFTLGIANASRLGENAKVWGSYYDHSPVVVAGRIQPALEAMYRARNPKGEAAHE